MHPHVFRAAYLPFQGLDFGEGQHFEALNDQLPRIALLTQHPIQAEVAGFTRQ